MKAVIIDDIEIQIVRRPIQSSMDDALRASLDPDSLLRYQRITHPGRQIEWCEGRRALQALPKSCLHLSLAHSESVVYAAGSSDPRVRGLGIDVEPRTRVVSTSVVEWLIREAERELPLSPLQIWTIKEAAFKADPDKSADTVLADYEIVSERYLRRPDSTAATIQYSVLIEDDWIVALAVVKN